MLNYVTAGLTIAVVTLVVTRTNGPGNIVKMFRDYLDFQVIRCPKCASFWLSFMAGVIFAYRTWSTALFAVAPGVWLSDAITFFGATCGIAWIVLGFTGSLTWDE